MVFLDVVYNHFGPSGNYLPTYAPQFFTKRHQTPWGDAINFDGEQSAPVRDFFIQNALFWLLEYRFDGLRLDAVHAIIDDSEKHILTELAETVDQRTTERHVHLVLENGDNESRHLLRRDDGRPQCYTAQWNDDFHHAVHVLLTAETSGYYEDYDDPGRRLLRCLTEGFAYQGEPSRHAGGRPRGEPSKALPPAAFVNFLQNHDQVGNRAFGERLSMLASNEAMRAAETLLLLLPTPILLFMGDEFRAPNPFPFFCEFDGELADAVREGRRNEFAHFFDAHDLTSIPDPNDEKTFEAARLDWSALDRAQHADAAERYARLLELRHDVLTPRLPASRGEGRMLGERALAVTWPLSDGSTLSVVANFAEEPTETKAWPPGRLLEASEPLSSPLPSSIPGWCTAWFLGDGR
jgi:malto-oligosyltrehalose trehalohydrolase